MKNLRPPPRLVILLLVSAAVLSGFASCKPEGQQHQDQRLSLLHSTSPVQRGINYLLTLQNPDGSFLLESTEGEDSAVAATGYAMVTLLHAQYRWSIPSEQISRGQAWLLSKQGPDGFWRYKPFLPPDLDDTAAAIGALASTNTQRMKAQQNVFALQRPDGSLRTWLISDQAALSLPPAFRVLQKSPGDPEVMAYFLQFVGDEEKFSEKVRSALRYVISKQRADGLWSSVYYRNPLYATYRISHVLGSHRNAFTPARSALEAAARAAGSVTSASGFGKSQLDIGFFLAIQNYAGRPICESHKKLYAMLLSAQQPNGSWPAEPLFLTDVSQQQNMGSARKFIANPIYSTATILDILMELKCPD